LKVNGENCDDGDLINDVGCLADCSAPAPGYTCSGGSITSATICTETCGDGKKTISEGCDDFNFVIGDGCSSTCQIELGYQCTVVP